MRTTENKKTKQLPSTRSLTIQHDIRFNRYSQTDISVLRLRGVWLSKLGFTPQQRVIVTAMDKQLVIRLEE